jgi:hypothetical protein
MKTTIKTYTPKPIPVCAIQYDGSAEMQMDLCKMGIVAYVKEGDYLVQHSAHGASCIVDKDTFERTYEEVKEETK